MLPRENLVLIGFHGQRQVGDRARRCPAVALSAFVDTDALIVKEAGQPISAIFRGARRRAFS
jgi:shikimate kinase